MSYAAPKRNAVNELHQGSIDGKYRQVSPNRGGVVDPATYAARADLSDVWYGLHESFWKTSGDGITATSPTYVPTPPAQPPAV